MDILKHIIATKIAEAQAAKERVQNKAKLDKILGLVAAKDDEALSGLSKEELLKIAEGLK